MRIIWGNSISAIRTSNPSCAPAPFEKQQKHEILLDLSFELQICHDRILDSDRLSLARQVCGVNREQRFSQLPETLDMQSSTSVRLLEHI